MPGRLEGRGPANPERLLEAAYSVVARFGLAKTSVEDVARAAGVSRATVYRAFPGGKDQVIAEVVAWEARRFFERLAAAVAKAPDLETLLEEALLYAHRAVEEHDVLQKILETEPERLVPALTVESNRLIGVIAVFLTPALVGSDLREGVEVREAADYLARMLLSFIGAQGRWDLTDREDVRLLVRTQLLAGVMREETS